MSGSDTLSRSMVEIRRADGAIAGAGFLITREIVCTCAHVINSALSKPPYSPDRPTGPVCLSFPGGGRIGDNPVLIPATLEHWDIPIPGPQFGGDVALLRPEKVPVDAEPVERYAVGTLALPGRRFEVFGYPSPGGRWADGVLGRTLPTCQWVQMEGTRGQGIPVQKGFSGAPVWDRDAGAVTGMVVSADTDLQVRVAFLIPARTLLLTFPTVVAGAAILLPGRFPRRNPLFTGRDPDLARVGAGFASGRALQAVIGPRGMGKTQLVLEYAYQHWHDYDALIWIDARSPESLQAGFSGTAKRLRLQRGGHDEPLHEVIREWLQSRDRWLLVLDNLNPERPEFVRRYLPESPRGHILLTSDSSILPMALARQPILLEKLPSAASKRLLLERAGWREHAESAPGVEEKAAEDLAQRLDHLPADLERAAAYVESRRLYYRPDYGFVSYLDDGGLGSDIATGDSDPAWHGTFDTLAAQSPASWNILQIVAILDADEIPLRFIIEGAEELGEPQDPLFRLKADPRSFDNLLRPLLRDSLVVWHVVGASLRTYRSVQRAVRERMKPAEHRRWAQRIVRALMRTFPADIEQNRERCMQLTPQIRAVEQALKDSGLLSDLTFMSLDVALLFLRAGRCLHGEDKPTLAEAMYMRAFGILRDLRISEYPHLAECMCAIAELYQDQSRHAEAERYYLDALEIRLRPLRAAASNMESLALLSELQGRSPEAENLYERAVALRSAAQTITSPVIPTHSG